MYGVTFLSRSFALCSQPPVSFSVDLLQWSSEGGPSLAQFTLRAPEGVPAIINPQSAISNLVELLRCPVQVWNEQGRVVWWGYLEALEFSGIRFDLASMANQVQATFTYSVDEGAQFVSITWHTTWVNDLGSQADFGVKQKIIPAGSVTLAQAESRRDQALADHGRPKPSFLIPKTQVPGVVLTCRGWYETLGWTYYANPAGLESYAIEGVGVQPVGDLAATTKFAQSIQPVVSAWDLACIWVKAARAAAPGDDLVVDLYADVTGEPGGAVLASGSLAGSSLSLDYGWVKVSLSPVVTLGSGVYWFVFSRSGGLDAANFYKLKVNEACGYSRGAAKVWDGSAWVARSPDADLNFTALGTEETTSQVIHISSTSACGQFLAGSKVEDASGLFSSPYRSQSKTGLQEVKDLLASGNSSGEGLVAFVDQSRVLHVRRNRRPYPPWGEPAGVTLFQGEDGIIRDPYGQAAQLDEIVAQWVKIQRPGLDLSESQFITRVEVDRAGKISLNG